MKMFGPLMFEDVPQSDVNSAFQSQTTQTRCILCEDQFNLSICVNIFVGHLFEVHRCVFDDVQNIQNIAAYVAYWRDRFKTNSIEEIIPSVKNDDGEKYFLFSSLLREDKVLRHQLALEYVMNLHEFEQKDEHFTKQCLLCKLHYKGSRPGFLNHLSQDHNLQLGNPQNLVFIEKLLHHIDQKLQSLVCIFCEGIFPERSILKEHMRKKLHKRINPSNVDYDKYYVVNYLEIDKNWRVIEKEDDRYALPAGAEENDDHEYSDWNEKSPQINCLFCAHTELDVNDLSCHMSQEHNFNFKQATEKLEYYQKIKFVNYIRKMFHIKKCFICHHETSSIDDLRQHVEGKNHCIMPKLDAFDQPEYYFPTYENDALLYLLDDMEHENGV